jgi:hypothetical protein
VLRRRKGRSLPSGFAVLLAVVSGACGGAASIGEATSDGPRVFRHQSSSGGGFDAQVQGELRYDETFDCFLLEQDGISYPVVWPVGTKGTADGPGVDLADGTTVRVGQQVSGGGGYRKAGAYMGDVVVPPECIPSSGEVAVYNSTEALVVES